MIAMTSDSHDKLKYKLFSGDQFDFASAFGKYELEFIKKLLGGVQLLVIDEAQRIEESVKQRDIELI